MTNPYFNIQGPGGKTKSESIRVTRNALNFGPMEWSRANTVPDMSWGRPGDIIIIDTTDGPSLTSVKDKIPTGVGIFMKLPLSYTIVPVGNAVTGFPAGKSTAGDVIQINGGNVVLNPPNSAVQAVADILAAGIPNITAFVLGEAVTVLEATGGSITISDTIGNPSTTLGLYSRVSLADSPVNGFWMPLDITAASASPSAPLAASFLTLANNAALGNERVLTAGIGITTFDTGPSGAYTISHTIDGVSTTLSEPIDPPNDKVLLHNDSTGNIEKTSIQTLLSASGTVSAKDTIQQRNTDISSPTPVWNIGVPLPDATISGGVAVVIRRVAIKIVNPFDVGTTIVVGDAGIADRLMSGIENDPTVVGTYETLSSNQYTPGNTQLTATITGPLTTGSATVVVEFILI